MLVQVTGLVKNPVIHMALQYGPGMDDLSCLMQACFDALRGLITVLDPELIPSDKCVMVLVDILSARSAEGKLPSSRYAKK
jgi:hypothetical protein